MRNDEHSFVNALSYAFKRIIVLLICYIAISGLWYSLELAMYGFITPSSEDSIIGILFAFSLRANIEKYLNWY